MIREAHMSLWLRWTKTYHSYYKVCNIYYCIADLPIFQHSLLPTVLESWFPLLLKPIKRMNNMLSRIVPHAQRLPQEDSHFLKIFYELSFFHYSFAQRCLFSWNWSSDFWSRWRKVYREVISVWNVAPDNILLDKSSI